MLKIVSLQTDEKNRLLSIECKLSHSDSITTVKQPVTFLVDGFTGKYNCKLSVNDCEGQNYQEVIDKMSKWLHRLSLGLKEDNQETKIPGKIWYIP